MLSSSDAGATIVPLRYPGGAEKRVEVRGSWNNWNTPVPLARHGGEWTATIALRAGTYEYKYIVDGEWLHLDSVPHVLHGGNLNNLLTVTGVAHSIVLEKTLRVMSFNIRYDNPSDKHTWRSRVDAVAGMLQYARSDFICLQEVLHHQLTDILSRLQGYDYIGVGRDDGLTSGEYSPVLYRKARFVPLQSTTFWLSETPAVPGSKGWGCTIPRICSVGVFRDLLLERCIVVANTHLDHINATARANGMKLIVRHSLLNSTDLTILTGDWNTSENTPPYVIASSVLADTRATSRKIRANPKKMAHEWSHTFCGFDLPKTYPTPTSSSCTIDFIFVTQGTQVALHSVLGVHYENIQISDHRPVIADLIV